MLAPRSVRGVARGQGPAGTGRHVRQKFRRFVHTSTAKARVPGGGGGGGGVVGTRPRLQVQHTLCL